MTEIRRRYNKISAEILTIINDATLYYVREDDIKELQLRLCYLNNILYVR